MKKMIRHGSLFSGIGGFDLAAEWCGWKNVFHCEINPFCNQVLGYYFPKSKGYEDIRNTDFTKYRGKIDVLTGGFPCQPFSVAGKRMGKADERHLWPAMLNVIRQIRPGWVVAENVLGITSWNGGMVFEEVWADLEAEGYQVQAYVLPAAGVGAPHRRDRVWFVACRTYKGPKCAPGTILPDHINGLCDLAAIIADTTGCGRDTGGHTGKGGPVQDNGQWNPAEGNQEQSLRGAGPGPVGAAAADPNGKHAQKRGHEAARAGKDDSKGKAGGPLPEGVQNYWDDWPSQPPLCQPYDGVSYRLDADTVFEGIPMPVKPISFPKWRQESIKAMGNAIVPQVALQIFRTIQQMKDLKYCQ
jgi:DNA (cytosine-5)-methyltransferase 1